MKIQSTRWCSRQLDSREIKKARLCFKALQTQGPLDLICLGSEFQIRYMGLGFRLDGLNLNRLTLSFSQA